MGASRSSLGLAHERKLNKELSNTLNSIYTQPYLLPGWYSTSLHIEIHWGQINLSILTNTIGNLDKFNSLFGHIYLFYIFRPILIFVQQRVPNTLNSIYTQPYLLPGWYSTSLHIEIHWGQINLSILTNTIGNLDKFNSLFGHIYLFYIFRPILIFVQQRVPNTLNSIQRTIHTHIWWIVHIRLFILASLS